MKLAYGIHYTEGWRGDTYPVTYDDWTSEQAATVALTEGASSYMEDSSVCRIYHLTIGALGGDYAKHCEYGLLESEMCGASAAVREREVQTVLGTPADCDTYCE